MLTAVPVRLIWGAVMLTELVAARFICLPAMVTPSGFRLTMLVPEKIWIPAVDSNMVCPVGVMMVIVGGTSVNMIVFCARVLIMRICGTGDGSGGGDIAFHKLPIT